MAVKRVDCEVAVRAGIRVDPDEIKDPRASSRVV